MTRKTDANETNHLKEHLALWYATAVVEVSNQAIGEDIGEVLKEMVEDADNEERRALDRMLADASNVALGAGQQLFQNLPQIVQQAQQVMQQFAQQPMQDPRLAIEGQKLQQQMQIEQMRMQSDQQTQQQRMAIDAQKMQQDAAQTQAEQQLSMAELQARVAIEQQRQQAEDRRQQADLDARMAMNTQDNATAMQLAAAEIESGERVAVSTGTGINPNP